MFQPFGVMRMKGKCRLARQVLAVFFEELMTRSLLETAVD